ncbi:MAG TPA: hypothetical protein VIL35_14510 [Vicinamibacterales bacterium]|jgi:hypothetical protein
MEALIPIMLGLGAFTLIGWTVSTIVENLRHKRMLTTVAGFHQKLIDRMDNAKEFSEFLSSEAGRRFLETLTIQRSHPGERILRSVQTGLVLSALGVGLILVEAVTEWDVEGGLRGIGMLFLAGGVGFLLSSAASWVLSKRMGLLPPSSLDATGRI